MCADMTDKEAMMTVTLTIPPQLVQKHAENILSGNGIYGESDNDKAMVLLFIFSFVLYFRMCMYLG
jgi:hypothetical protein